MLLCQHPNSGALHWPKHNHLKLSWVRHEAWPGFSLSVSTQDLHAIHFPMKVPFWALVLHLSWTSFFGGQSLGKLLGHWNELLIVDLQQKSGIASISTQYWIWITILISLQEMIPSAPKKFRKVTKWSKCKSEGTGFALRAFGASLPYAYLTRNKYHDWSPTNSPGARQPWSKTCASWSQLVCSWGSLEAAQRQLREHFNKQKP